MSASWAEQFVIVLGLWLLGSLGVILLLGMWDRELYFITSYVGFLLAVEYSEPRPERPTWHRRLRWMSLIGLLLFGYVVINWVARVTGMTLA